MTKQNNKKRTVIYIKDLAYSFHLGSDKNKKNISKQKAKTNKSGTTTLSNNAIQNAKQLSRVDKHNYRKYDVKQDEIVIIKGTNSLYNDIKKLYVDEFEEARLEYNNKQIRDDRKINDYFSNISNNEKNDLACEIIIELGDKKFWDTKDKDYKLKMTNVYSKQVNDLKLLLPDFKIASAIIHYDETSPHMHIVGVPIKYKNKNGLSKQVGKSNVFTKDSLKTLQNKMRLLCIESFNNEYKSNYSLKEKQKGRNKDIHVSDMTDYQELKDDIIKNKTNLENINNNSKTLDAETNNLKQKIDNLKLSKLNKNNFIITTEDKETIDKYISSVSKSNKEYKNIHNLSLTLTNVDDTLKTNNETIKTLTENNEALTLRVNTLSKQVDKKNEEILELKSENKYLSRALETLKSIFNSLVNLIESKFFTKDRNKYFEFAKDLFKYDILSRDRYDDIKDVYENSEYKDKKRDDLER